jgi:hypothetical protein
MISSAPFDFSAMRLLRLALLLVIGLNLLMIGIRISLYHPLLGLPGGPRFVIEPIVLLIGHALLVVWATNGGGPVRQTILLNGTVVGLISGGLEITHVSVENFAGWSAREESISTGLFMLGLFLLWGLAGYLTARSTGAVGPALLAGSWSAIVAMLLTAAIGLVLLNTSLRRLELKNIGSPDLIRSGWTDLRAFTIADLFEAVVKVLLVGPILGAIFGGLGGLMARMFGVFKQIM